MSATRNLCESTLFYMKISNIIYVIHKISNIYLIYIYINMCVFVEIVWVLVNTCVMTWTTNRQHEWIPASRVFNEPLGSYKHTCKCLCFGVSRTHIHIYELPFILKNYIFIFNWAHVNPNHVAWSVLSVDWCTFILQSHENITLTWRKKPTVEVQLPFINRQPNSNRESAIFYNKHGKFPQVLVVEV